MMNSTKSINEDILTLLRSFEQDESIVEKALELNSEVENTLGKRFKDAVFPELFYHNFMHLKTVGLLCCYFCLKTNNNPILGSLSGFFHDIGRVNDGEDKGHDERSIKIFNTFLDNGILSFLSQSEVYSIKSAIIEHDSELMSYNDSLSSVLKDADRCYLCVYRSIYPDHLRISSTIGHSFAIHYILEKFSEKDGENIFVYHTTSSNNLESIYRDGIKPNTIVEGRPYSENDKVFFTISKNDFFEQRRLEYFQKKKTNFKKIDNIPKDKIVLLKTSIKRNRLDRYRVVKYKNPRPFYWCEFIVDGQVSKDDIVECYDTGYSVEFVKKYKGKISDCNNLCFLNFLEKRCGKDIYIDLREEDLLEVEDFGPYFIPSYNFKKKILSMKDRQIVILNDVQAFPRPLNIQNIINVNNIRDEMPCAFFAIHYCESDISRIYSGGHNGESWTSEDDWFINPNLGSLSFKKIYCANYNGNIYFGFVFDCKEFLPVTPIFKKFKISKNNSPVEFYLGSCNNDFNSAISNIGSIKSYRIPHDLDLDSNVILQETLSCK